MTRGLRDILIAVVDGLMGLSYAIRMAFRRIAVQNTP